MISRPLIAAVFGLMLAQSAIADSALFADATRKAMQSLGAGNSSTVAPSAGQLEVGFSPNDGAEELVLKVIRSSKSSLRVMAYSFTSAPITRSLLEAKRRGIDVQIVADEGASGSGDKSGKARAALGALRNAGVPVRLATAYAIHHDKVIISDNAHVQTGSFNYSDAAARKNSENVLVVWSNPQLANAYLKHWESRFAQAQPFLQSY